jgi:hypothetical protein
VKVGFDIPAGRYLLTGAVPACAYEDGANARSDSVRTVQCEGRLYIDAADGQYLQLTGSVLHPAAALPPPAGEGGKYEAGQYTVGADIPYGRYRLTRRQGTDFVGWYGVTFDSPYYVRSIRNDNPAVAFSGDVLLEAVELDLTEEHLRLYGADFTTCFLMFDTAVLERVD